MGSLEASNSFVHSNSFHSNLKKLLWKMKNKKAIKKSLQFRVHLLFRGDHTISHYLYWANFLFFWTFFPKWLESFFRQKICLLTTVQSQGQQTYIYVYFFSHILSWLTSFDISNVWFCFSRKTWPLFSWQSMYFLSQIFLTLL